nr:acyl-coa desaturase [Quercus suber]
MYTMTGFGIVGGYHRLWAHRSYNAVEGLKYFYALAGGAATQGSVLAWSRQHRAHHRYTDTEKDPHSIAKGFWHAHMGWLFVEQPDFRDINVRDLLADPVVVWQHENYLWIVLGMSLVLPTALAGSFWGDAMGGFVFAGLLRTFIFQQSTFCVNSLAHWAGDQPFGDEKSARNHFLTAIVTFGEGYHNFHHMFPSDFRASVMWWHYDPTKWMLWVIEWLGLATNLQRFCSQEIEKASIRHDEKVLARRRESVQYGMALEDLPLITWSRFSELCRTEDRKLIVVAGVVHDVGAYMSTHPGGEAYLTSSIGKDATSSFHGGVYAHGVVAQSMLRCLRVAIIDGNTAVHAKPATEIL